MKIRYKKIKEKVRSISQDYRKAVTEGHNSGNGKLVCDNWDIWKELWQGYPAGTMLANSISLFVESYPQDSELEAERETESEETVPTDISANS